MSFKIITHVIKSRHEEAKITNPIREHLVVLIYANLIGYKTPNGMEAAKHVELIATVFSINGIGVLVHADHP